MVLCYIRANFRLAPSQWETSLQSNTVSHWLGANLESTLYTICWWRIITVGQRKKVTAVTFFRCPTVIMNWNNTAHWLKSNGIKTWNNLISTMALMWYNDIKKGKSKHSLIAMLGNSVIDRGFTAFVAHAANAVSTSATPAKWMIAGETLVALRNGLTTCIHQKHSHLVLMYDVPVWFSACPLIHVYKRSYPSLRCACGGRAERPQMVYMNDNTSLIHQIKFRHNLNPCAHPRWLVEWSSTLWSIKFWPSIPK